MILSGKSEAFAEHTRRRVIAAAKAAGYRPNPIARALSTGRTGMISLWLWSNGLQDSYHDRVSHEMQLALRRYPHQMLVSPLGPWDIETAPQKSLSPWDVDGVVAHEASPAVSALLGRSLPYPVPIVSTGGYNLVPGVDTVALDLAQGVEEAVLHLLAPGRRRVAYLAERSARYGMDLRNTIYTRLLCEAGLQPEFIAASDVSRSAGRHAVREYAAHEGLPDAIFCHNDTLAIGAARALADVGARIPDDVALVGCDGIEDTEYQQVPISTIVSPLGEMCETAVRYLEARIREPEAPLQFTTLVPRLAIRESSRV